MTEDNQQTVSPQVVSTKRTTCPDGKSPNEIPYRDVIGRYRTESLFLETINKGNLDPEVYWPIWTLEERDKTLTEANWYSKRYPGRIIPSLRRLYLQEADPAEYDFAMKFFGSDRHWKILTKSKFFQPYLEEWRETLEVKLRSEATKTMRDLSLNGPGPQALQAAKWLAEGNFKPKAEKGRPSSQSMAVATRKELDTNRMLMEDAERMGLKIEQA